MNIFTFIGLIGIALTLGLRHGIDWDHIAAISDITGSNTKKKTALLYATMYALGHTFVILALGFLAVLLGVKIPNWIDTVMEPVVGVTLIFLGVWLVTSMFVLKEKFRLKSRWTILFEVFHHFYHRFRKKHKHIHNDIPHPKNPGIKTSFFIGILHGIGAETPTQLLLFVTAAGVGKGIFGISLVLTFVLGLLISNSCVALLSIFGYNRAQKNGAVYRTVGFISGVFSVLIGILFLFGKTSLLPTISG